MNDKLKRPYVFTSTGVSLDGKISTKDRKCSPISRDDNRDMLFDARVRADAVMIGGTTLRLDDSGLTVKSIRRQKKRLKMGKSEEPIKVAIVSNLKGLNLNGSFFNKGSGKVIIFTSHQSSVKDIKNTSRKSEVYVCGIKKVDLKKALKILKEVGVKELLVEGGGELIYSLLENDLIDEINLKIGDLIWGGRKSPTLVDGEGFDLGLAKHVKIVNFKKKDNVVILKCIIDR